VYVVCTHHLSAQAPWPEQSGNPGRVCTLGTRPRDDHRRLSLLSGAAIVYARLSSAWSPERLTRIGRVLLGICATSFTLEQAFYLEATAKFVPKWIPPTQIFWAVTTTVLFALAAVALLTNRMALLASRLLTLMIVALDYSCGYRWFFRIPTVIRTGANSPRPSRLPERYGYLRISSASTGLMTIARDPREACRLTMHLSGKSGLNARPADVD
jgi:hypothetical protein